MAREERFSCIVPLNFPLLPVLQAKRYFFFFFLRKEERKMTSSLKKAKI